MKAKETAHVDEFNHLRKEMKNSTQNWCSMKQCLHPNVLCFLGSWERIGERECTGLTPWFTPDFILWSIIEHCVYTQPHSSADPNNRGCEILSDRGTKHVPCTTSCPRVHNFEASCTSLHWQRELLGNSANNPFTLL